MTILKYTLAMLLLGLLPFFAQAQDYYIQKDDAGLNTAPYQDSLEQHAKDLVFAIPEGPLRDAFRVYGFGFYQHSEATDGYPAAFEKMRTQIASETPYYLIFGKQTDKSGVYTRFWVDLKLPEGGCFDKLGAIEKDAFILTFKTYIDDQYVVLEKSASNYASAEMKGIDSLKNLIIQIIDCCNNPNKSGGSCLPCPENSTILTWLLENNFIGLPCDINNYPNIGVYPNVYNYSTKSIQGDNIFQNASIIVSSLPSSSSGSANCYVTDNDNLCLNHLFDSVNVKYTQNLNDHDFWIHIWHDDNGNGFLFVKSEQYFLADDEDFFPDEIISAKGGSNPEAINSERWLMIDTGNDKLYLSDMPRSLPLNTFLSPHHEYDELHYHIVVAGESFSSIAALSNGSFSAQQLATWNNVSLNSTIHPGDTLIVFPNTYFLSEFEDSHVSTIAIPVVKPELLSLTYKFKTTNKKLIDFSVTYPELKMNKKPSYIEIVSEPVLGWSGNPVVWPVEVPAPTIETVPENGNMPKLPWITRNPWVATGGMIIAFVLMPVNAGVVAEGSPGDFLKEQAEIEAKRKPLIEPSPNAEPKDGELGYYVTYTKVQSGVTLTEKPDGTNISQYTTRTYVGRSRGVGTPNQIVKQRNYGHHKNGEAGYTKYGCLDKAARIQTKQVWDQAARHADPSYQFIRGREQNVMDDVGMPWVMMPDQNNKMTRSGNAINGISRANVLQFALWTSIARTYSGVVPFSWAPLCLPFKY